jgi:hypothetical protein
MNRTRRAALLLALALGIAAGTAATGCSHDSDSDSRSDSNSANGQAASRPAASADSLEGVCPATVVVQDNWWPQAEYGPVYRLLGAPAHVDTQNKSVSGPLVSHGADTGVRIEIRSGGPANNFTPAAKVLYLDRSVTLGGTDLDQAALFSRAQPVLAVFAPMDISPLVLMWDPKAHPDFRTVADIGRAGTRVLYYQGATYMEYLVGAGLLHRSQVEGSYDGTPARFVTERGKVVQQGYLTNEVYQYENELPQWKKKVAWTLVDSSGYPNYIETLAIRADRKAELTPCLRKLVPILQRGAADYAADPGPTNDLIVKLVKDFDAFAYSPQRAAHATATMKQAGILGNGGNGTVGDFDAARAQRVLGIVKPIFAAHRTPVRDGLAPGDLYTNEFIDPSIGIKR